MSDRTVEQRGLALGLAYFTVGYNVLEGVLSVLFAARNDSSALLGFGIDSFVESLSGMAMIWRFSDHRPGDDQEQLERRAIRFVGLSLIALSGYVAYEAGLSLYSGVPPERSLAGLLIAALSLIVMPALFVLKRRTAKAIDSRSLAADATQTLACILLSVALLVGTGLHYFAGLWQADSLAGLVISAYLIREGYRAWTDGDLCDSC